MRLSLHQLQIQLTDEVKRWVIEQTCTARSYGARPLRRALQRYVEDPLSESFDRRPPDQLLADRNLQSRQTD